MSVDLWQSDLLSALPWCAHGFTGRFGGVSVGPFRTLNLGLHVRDAPDLVLQNRSIAATSLGFGLEDMICAQQVHGGLVRAVDALDRGRGAMEMDDAVPSADGLVTATPGLLLTLFFADCAPVFLADLERHVVAVAHAGWRGVVSGVVENTIARMVSESGSNPRDLVAAVGPSIGQCCFEVGAEVAAQFHPRFVSRESAGAKPHVDLKSAVAQRLRDAGLPPEGVGVATACTACDPQQYFSHRREAGLTGRMAAMIGVRAH